MHMPPVPGILGMSLNSKDFEVALRAELNSKFLAHLPKEFLKMRVGDFLQYVGRLDANKTIVAQCRPS